MIDLVHKSQTERLELMKQRLAMYRAAKTPDAREDLRVRFFDDMKAMDPGVNPETGKKNAMAAGYFYNTRAANYLLLARPPHGVSAVDDAFVRTVKDIFMNPERKVKPLKRRGKQR